MFRFDCLYTQFNENAGLPYRHRRRVVMMLNKTENVRINIQAHSLNHCCHEKVICITYSECVCVCIFSMKSACAVFYCNLWFVRLYFPTLSPKRQDFRGKKQVLNAKIARLDFLYNFVRNISHSKKNSVGYDHECT